MKYGTGKDTMKALWLEDNALSFRDDIPIPVPTEGDALVRLLLAGVCSTDLELVRGYYPYTGIPGHEFVGEVMEAPGHPEWKGQRVVGEINLACGECQACLAGRQTHCQQRRVLGIKNCNGVFAETFVLPLVNLHCVGQDIPDEVVVFTEPLAAALEIQEQVTIHPDDHLLLIGAGRLGQLIAQSLAVIGVDIHVVARHPHQRELLAARQISVITDEEALAQEWDVVVEATGVPGGFELARRLVRPRGTIVLKSTYKGDMQVNFSAIVVDEITLIGSRCGPFEPALQLLAGGKVDPRALITARYSLPEGLLAFEHAAMPGALKVLIEW